MGNNELSEFQKHLLKVKYYASKINGVSINIENMDPNYVYLMHNTSLAEGDIKDVYTNGLVYTGNEIWRTFNNLSKDWPDKSWAKKAVDESSMEEVIVEHCKDSSMQCFLYKVPLVFFEPIDGNFFPIPIWFLDNNFKYKSNPNSSNIPYNPNEKKVRYFRFFPTLLLGHYDLKTNQFYKNPNYSPLINNSKGIYDIRQLFHLDEYPGFENLWQHNELILNGDDSPFEIDIDEITKQYNEYFVKIQKIL